MKKIKGKVEFLVYPYNKTGKISNGFDVDVLERKLIEAENDGNESYLLSEITEEQAFGLVDYSESRINNVIVCYDYMKKTHGLPTAKESLISLLKSNGLICKSMDSITPIDVLNAYRKGNVDVIKLPNDFLIIKTK